MKFFFYLIQSGLTFVRFLSFCYSNNYFPVVLEMDYPS